MASMSSTGPDDVMPYVNETVEVDVTRTTLDVSLNDSSDNMTFGNVTGNFDMMAVYQTYAPFAVAVDRVASLICYFIGIPCNPLCAFIWLGRQTRKSNSSAIYLGALSISHTIFLLIHIFSDLNYAWGITTFKGRLSCELFFTMFYCPQYLAPLLVLGFTVERYIAVCYPFAKEKYCTVRRAVIVVLSLLVFCILLSCMHAYLWTYDEAFEICNHRQELQNSNFPQLWNWVTELTIFGVAPFAALIINILVIREIRSITSRGPPIIVGGTPAGPGGRRASSKGKEGGQNQASTLMLMTVSFYLICTWLPATLVYSLEREFPIDGNDLSLQPPLSQTWRRHFTYFTIRKCVEEVTLTNSAFYFFIYCLTGKHFRDRFKQLVCPKRCLRASTSNGSYAASEVAANGRNHAAPRNQYIALSNKANNGCVESTQTEVTCV